ncbi:MAG: MFS transporter [Dehalococcoidia bacterium]|nr:MFS transporter [Dehalococcoidia bacterium]
MTLGQRLRSGPQYKWLVLVTVGLGILTSTVDGSITNIALPELGKVFGVDPSVILWVSVAYLLASIGLMLTLGSLGDAIGRKQVFLTGFLVFGIGLVITPLSTTLPMLLFGRVVQGIGQAMILANGNALVVDAFPDSERGRAIGMENAFVGVGLASGPPLGGFLLDLWGWQSLFWTRAPFMAAFFVMGLLFLRNDRQEGNHVRFDILGAVALFGFISAFLLALNRGPKLGWTEPVIIGMGTLAIVMFIGFLFVESRQRMPIMEIQMRGIRFLRDHLPVLELTLFRNRMFSFANATNALQFLSQGAIVILLPFFLLEGRGFTATEAGLILITLPVVRLVVAPVAGWAADKAPSRIVSTFGLLVMTGAYFGLRSVGIDTPVALLVTLLLLEGTGSSIFGPGNNSAIMGSVPPSHLGTASGMIGTVRQISMATGIAVAGTLYAVIQSNEESRLLEAGVAAEEALSRSVTMGFQDVLTIMVVTLVAAIFVSIVRGKDPPHRDLPRGGRGMGAPAAQRQGSA